MEYNLRFFPSSKYSLFHNSDLFWSCIFYKLYTGCAKIKKNNSGTERLSAQTLKSLTFYLSRTLEINLLPSLFFNDKIVEHFCDTDCTVRMIIDERNAYKSVRNST